MERSEVQRKQELGAHSIDIRVYYEDTDCGGVVYYGKYLGYLERGRTEWLRARGVRLEEYHRKNIVFVVAHCDISYKASARYDDLLTVETTLEETSGIKMVFHSRVWRRGNTDDPEHGPDQMVVDGRVTLACVDWSTGKPLRIPDELKAALMNL